MVYTIEVRRRKNGEEHITQYHRIDEECLGSRSLRISLGVDDEFCIFIEKKARRRVNEMRLTPETPKDNVPIRTWTSDELYMFHRLLHKGGEK